MKAFILSMITCSFILFSLPASADKITLTGAPVVVTEQGGVYVPATTVTTGQDHYFFTINDTRRICYEQVNPILPTKVNAGLFQVQIGDSVVSLHCYTYDPEYFVIQ